MVQGIDGRVKRYVCVTARIDEDGRTRPMSVQWWNGETYPIEKVVSVCRRSSKRVGGDVYKRQLCFQGAEREGVADSGCERADRGHYGPSRHRL